MKFPSRDSVVSVPSKFKPGTVDNGRYQRKCLFCNLLLHSLFPESSRRVPKFNTGILTRLLGRWLTGCRLWVCLFASYVSVLNTATNAVVATLKVGANPAQLSLTPNGAALYVPNAGARSVSVSD